MPPCFLHLHMAQTRGPPFDPRIVRLEPSHGGYTGLGGLSTALEKRCSGSLRSLVGWARFVFATTTYLVSPLRYQCSYLRCRVQRPGSEGRGQPNSPHLTSQRFLRWFSPTSTTSTPSRHRLRRRPRERRFHLVVWCEIRSHHVVNEVRHVRRR